MPHPDNVDVLFVDIATTALERILEGIASGELAGAVVEVVHKAQRHQRLCTAAKLRLLTRDGIDTAYDGAELERRMLELARELEGE